LVRKACKYLGLDVQCVRALKGSPDNLYHNNGDGTFTDVSKKSEWMIPARYADRNLVGLQQ